MNDTLAEKLARRAAAIEFARLPPTVVREAKRCLVDASGVMLAGLASEVSKRARAYARSQYAVGLATLLGEPARIAAAGAAFANGVAAHVLDFDDTCYDGIAHGSAAVWPAVLAAGEAHGANGEDLLTAFVAGVETIYALGRALTNRGYFKGWWNSGLLGSMGAAVGAAKVSGLGAEAAREALSIAVSQATGPRVFSGNALKPYALGRAAEAGVHAAGFARCGLGAPADVFEHRNGFIKLFNDGILDEGALARVEERYSLIDPGIAFKLYPACSAVQAAAEAVQDILARERIPAREVTRVHCAVTPLVNISLPYGEPKTPVEAQFSLQFAVGCMLAYGGFGVEHLTRRTLGDPPLLENMRKVIMTEDTALVATGQAKRDFPEGAMVTLATRDGREFKVYNGAATGMPVKPMPGEMLERKFRSCAAPVIGAGAAEALLERLKNIETLARADALFSH